MSQWYKTPSGTLVLSYWMTARADWVPYTGFDKKTYPGFTDLSRELQEYIVSLMDYFDYVLMSMTCSSFRPETLSKTQQAIRWEQRLALRVMTDRTGQPTQVVGVQHFKQRDLTGFHVLHYVGAKCIELWRSFLHKVVAFTFWPDPFMSYESMVYKSKDGFAAINDTNPMPETFQLIERPYTLNNEPHVFYGVITDAAVGLPAGSTVLTRDQLDDRVTAVNLHYMQFKQAGEGKGNATDSCTGTVTLYWEHFARIYLTAEGKLVEPKLLMRLASDDEKLQLKAVMQCNYYHVNFCATHLSDVKFDDDGKRMPAKKRNVQGKRKRSSGGNEMVIAEPVINRPITGDYNAAYLFRSV